MGLFRKSQPVSDPHPIIAFWTWWSDEGRNIDPHTASAAADELTRRVRAIHPDLAWHFGAGEVSQHRLTVSAGGLAGVRPAAERWRRAAPPSDATWEFRSSQQADPGALSSVLEIAGHKIDLASMTFRVDPVEERLRVHVGVYHPAFGQLPDSARAQVTYLVLDWLIGEDDVERWLGHIEPLGAAPVPTKSADEFRAAVAEIAAQRDPDEWVLAQWQDEQGVRGLATFRCGLRWIDNPTLDRHQVISAGYTAQEDGLPVDAASLEALREIEAELESLLGTRGLLIGYETHRGVRAFHAYTDGEDQNIDAALGNWASTRRLPLESQPDPAWSQVRRFTG
jgi:hypothetical protein